MTAIGQTDRRPPEPRRPAPPFVAHGGIDVGELVGMGLRPHDVLDFSVNSNPLGASPRAVRAAGMVDPSQYPDRHATRLRSAIATAHGVADDEVVAGNGSVELLWLLADCYLRRGDRALIIGPTFGEYAAFVARQGGDVVFETTRAADGFRPDLDRILAAVSRAQPRLIFVCNPNNPTGQVLELAALRLILEAAGSCLVVVDEAYIDFADGVDSALALRPDPRVVVVRSLTKNYGLAGLRLGYLVADRRVAEALRAAQLPWSVSTVAQAAGVAALGDVEHLEQGRALTRRSKAHLVDGLESLGLRCVPSRTNFWLVEVGDGAGLRARLLRHGILVRDCASFGLPTYVRIAARPIEESRRLIGVLERLIASELA